MVGKGEKAGYQPFLLYQQSFLKGFFFRVVEGRDCKVNTENWYHDTANLIMVHQASEKSEKLCGANFSMYVSILFMNVTNLCKRRESERRNFSETECIF